jgi:hypothetical protein
LDIFYDSTLDDGPILLEDPPCLELVTNLWEDKDDMLAVCDNTLTHESPTLFLNSPIYTIEKFLYAEKYLCGLKLSCTNNHSTHNHHVYDVSCNYFERGRRPYLYVFLLFKIQPTDHHMHWLPQNCCYLFIYKMPMHRKGVRLKS